MKRREELKKYFDVLEVPIDSSMSDIRKAYMLLREVYSTESIVTLPVEGEVSPEEKMEILNQIEEAYHSLLSYFHLERDKPTEDIGKIISDIEEFTGAALKQVRKRLKMNLDDIALATKIQREHLESIEAENFAALPVYVYTRGFVVNYAKYLSLDPEKVSENFMTRFKNWQENNRATKK